MINKQVDYKIVLLYRGTRDGFTWDSFHSKCDDHPKTVIVVRSNNNIFGGYTSSTWNNQGGFISDSNAFLFNLRKQV